ncbi:MAG: hypothetical protein AAGL69_10380 [Pseudomonadota bacterium]
MSTSSPELLTLDAALAAIPKKLRTKLVKFYSELKKAFVKGDYDSCGTRSGKFCETLIRVLQNMLEGKHDPFGKQVNIYTEARRLEQLSKTVGPEPLRVFVPRALCFLYTLRNKRGFAHVGGDVDADKIDAATCVRVADWCLCELIRVVHALSLEEAQAIIDAIASREIPEVWAVAGKRRVLRNDLGYKEQTLLLIYTDVEEAVLIEDLFEWTEYSRMDNYKTRILKPLHDKRLIDWDKETDTVVISPTGVAEVEDKILNVSRV